MFYLCDNKPSLACRPCNQPARYCARLARQNGGDRYAGSGREAPTLVVTPRTPQQFWATGVKNISAASSRTSPKRLSFSDRNIFHPTVHSSCSDVKLSAHTRQCAMPLFARSHMIHTRTDIPHTEYHQDQCRPADTLMVGGPRDALYQRGDVCNVYQFISTDAQPVRCRPSSGLTNLPQPIRLLG